MQVTRHLDPDAFLAAVGADGRARRGVGQLLHRRGACDEANAAARGRARLPRDVPRTRPDSGRSLQRDDGPVVIGAERRDGRRIRSPTDLAREWPALQGVVGALAAMRGVRAAVDGADRTRARAARAPAPARADRGRTTFRRRPARRASPTTPTRRG